MKYIQTYGEVELADLFIIEEWTIGIGGCLHSVSALLLV